MIRRTLAWRLRLKRRSQFYYHKLIKITMIWEVAASLYHLMTVWMAPLVASDVTAGMQIYDEKWHFKMKVAHHFYSRRGGARLSALRSLT